MNRPRYYPEMPDEERKKKIHEDNVKQAKEIIKWAEKRCKSIAYETISKDGFCLRNDRLPITEVKDVMDETYDDYRVALHERFRNNSEFLLGCISAAEKKLGIYIDPIMFRLIYDLGDNAFKSATYDESWPTPDGDYEPEIKSYTEEDDFVLIGF